MRPSQNWSSGSDASNAVLEEVGDARSPARPAVVRLPGLYYSADRLAGQAQRRYLLHAVAALGSLVIGSLLFSLGLNTGGIQRASPLAFTALSAVLTLRLWQSRDAQTWFDARSVAESVKSLAWRYMMRADPFKESDDELVDKDFISSMKEVLKQSQSVSNMLTVPDMPSAITDEMRRVRALGYEERLATYLQGRIRDQISWYSAKAMYNRRRQTMWYIAAVVSQVAAIAVGILAWHRGIPDLSGFLLTLATAVLSWMQLKRHGDLAQSYTRAAQELGLVLSLAPHVKRDADLNRFVAESEGAISREHTLWIVRGAPVGSIWMKLSD